jgi:acyl-CoA dehydrogenase
MTTDGLSQLDLALTELLDAHAAPLLIQADEGNWSRELWSALNEFGAFGLGLDPEFGGVGGTSADAARAIRVGARHATPMPLAEAALLGGWALTRERLNLPEGPLTAAVPATDDSLTGVRDGSSVQVDGSMTGVAWARFATNVVTLCSLDGGGYAVVSLPTASLLIHPEVNLAGEPRDDAQAADVLVPAGSWAPTELTPATFLDRAIACLALAICGAGERILELTVQYTKLRHQFGRSLSSFQATQQSLAQLAGAVAAAQGAAHVATRALSASDARTCQRDAVASKIVASESASKIAALAHQLHGAIGMTSEYDLQLYTRRLWSWRDECGTEHQWSNEYGRLLSAEGENPWHGLVPAEPLPVCGP